jgi:CRISPR/Cas system-associated exonuclease Cas4 (RecB family)
MPLLDKVTNFQKHWVEQTLDDYDQSDKREPKVRDYFTPSNAHWCPRAIWYHMTGTPQDPVDSNGLRRMGVGSVYHEWIQEKLEKAGILVSAELEVTHDDPSMKGFYDGIIKNPETDEDYLIEIKSRNDNKKSLPYLPRTEHLIQWNLYSVMTDVVKGLIFYVNKNTQEYNIYETQRNNKIVDKIFHKMKKIKDYLDRGEIVPYQPKENHDWCPFKSTCERDYFVKGI